MKVPLLDLKIQYQKLKTEIEPVLLETMASAQYIMGPAVEEFERAIQAYCKTKHAVACANGSDALRLALMAAGVGPGDEVLIPTYTFFATAGAVSLVGATPVFCDIESDFYNIDVQRLEKHITPKTKAIIPVHLYGQMAEMDSIMSLARKYNLTVIEDGAQAIGAFYQGRSMGSIGHMATLSFFPSKNLGCAGDGGMLLTNNDQLAEQLRILRIHGSKPKYYHQWIGFNSRLDTIQAAILNIKLKYLDEWTEARAKNAALYSELFKKLEGQEFLKTPQVASFTTRHVYNQYVVRVKARDQLREFLAKKEIGTEIYYPLPLHRQKCFEGFNMNLHDFPNADQAAQETLALPIYPELTRDQLEHVASSITEFFKTL